MARRARQNGDNGRLATQQSVNAAIKSIGETRDARWPRRSPRSERSDGAEAC
jgi:hypothetical protein